MKTTPSARPHLDYDHNNEDKLQEDDGFDKAKKPYLDHSSNDMGHNKPLDKRRTKRKSDRQDKKISDRKARDLEEDEKDSEDYAEDS
ncbi:MAG: hypothetical protein ACPGEF_01350 [Endozoicomonas sp.]